MIYIITDVHANRSRLPSLWLFIERGEKHLIDGYTISMKIYVFMRIVYVCTSANEQLDCERRRPR